MFRRVACLYCGARMVPDHRRCAQCRRPAIPVIADRFVQRRRLGIVDGLVSVEAFDRDTGYVAYVQVLLPHAPAAVRQALAGEARVLQATAARMDFPRLLAGGPLHQTSGAFTACEWVEGLPLDKALRNSTVPDTLELYLRALEPVAFLHQHGLVHCAIAPARFWVCPNGRVVLLNLLQVRQVGSPGQGSGVPKYQAPEQQRPGMPVTPATDVYACGAVLYRLLTNRMPHGPRAFPASARNNLITPDLDELLCLALENGPENRFPSAREMQVDLAGLLGPRTERDPFGVPAPYPAMEFLKTLAKDICFGTVMAGHILFTATRIAARLLVLAATRYVHGMARLTGATKVQVAAVTTCIALLAIALAVVPIPTPRLRVEAGDAPSPALREPTGEDRDKQLQPFPAFVPPMDMIPWDAPDPAWITVHTWPPSMVYVEDVFLLEAPAPDQHPLAPGEHAFRLVSRTGEQQQMTIVVESGKRYRLLVNFESGFCEVMEEDL